MSEQRYKIYEQLGAGGNGAVFRAYDTQLKRWVAIKRLLTAEEASGSDPTTEELRREADTLASLRNANIVTIFDVAMDDDGLFIVMELLQGPDLADTIAHGPMGLEDFKQLAEQTLEAMLAAHQLRVMHRDIKPENIKVERLPGGRMQAKIIDFGLARAGLTARKQTEAGGTVMGSIYYMAPEQLTRKPTDQRTDLYSLGCVFYETLAGRKAFDGKTVNDVIDKHVDDEVVPLATLCPHLPQWLTYWVMRLMACKPEDRPRDAQQAIEEFRAWEKLPAMPGMAPWMPMYGASYGAVPGYNMPVQGYPPQVNPTTGYYPQVTSASTPVQPVTTGQVPHVTTGQHQAKATGATPSAKKAAAKVAKSYGPKKAAPDAAAAQKKKILIGAGVGVALVVAYLATRGGDETAASSSSGVGSAAVSSAPPAVGLGTLQNADDQLFPKDRPFPILDKHRVIHCVSAVNLRGFKAEPSGELKILNSSEPIAAWDDLTIKGKNTLLSSVGKPENSPKRIIWTNDDGQIKSGKVGLDFRSGGGSPRCMVAQFTDEVSDSFPFGEDIALTKPGLTMGATYGVDVAKLPSTILRLSTSDGSGSLVIRVGKDKKLEAEFKANGQTKILKDSTFSGEVPCSAIVTWDAEGIRLYQRNSRGGSGKTNVEPFPKPNSPMYRFQIGSTDKAQAFEGVLSEVVLYSTALKEDQAAMLMKDIFEQYLQTPRPKPLAERMTNKKPLFDRAAWKMSASHNNNQNEINKTIDSDTTSRWSSNVNQTAGMWFQIDLGSALRMGGIVMDTVSNPNDYPRDWKVEVSNDKKTWQMVKSGKGPQALLEIKFDQPVTASHLRITQSGSAYNHWAISELAIFQP
jgi:hypothetical protein